MTISRLKAERADRRQRTALFQGGRTKKGVQDANLCNRGGEKIRAGKKKGPDRRLRPAGRGGKEKKKKRRNWIRSGCARKTERIMGYEPLKRRVAGIGLCLRGEKKKKRKNSPAV